MSAPSVHGYTDAPRGEEPRSRGRVSGGSGFTGTWDAGRTGTRDQVGDDRAQTGRIPSWATPADLAAPSVEEPERSWGYADDGSWVGAAGASAASAGDEWWEGATPVHSGGWAQSPAEGWGPAGDDEPPSSRRKATKVAIGISIVVALLVVGIVAFGGTILLGGGPGGGSAANRATGGQAGAPVLPGPANPTGGYPDLPTTAPTAPGAGATTHAPVPTKAPATKTPTVPGGALANPVQESAVLGLVNQYRGQNGCRSLSFDGKLADAARKHSQDMATRRYFSHDTPDGVSMADRINAENYRWSMIGENIAEGQKDADAVMTAWMNSPGHRANILNCKYTQIGIGLAYQGRTPVWTQDFGTPLR